MRGEEERWGDRGERACKDGREEEEEEGERDRANGWVKEESCVYNCYPAGKNVLNVSKTVIYCGKSYFQVRYAYACSMAFRGRHFECGF